ncbi:MAG: hypothetical protein ABI321_00050 [Polyangia bacterium]
MASARPAPKVLSGMPVRVAIAGHLERAIGLHSSDGAWQLSTARSAITRAELVDETAATHEKWIVTTDGNDIVLDAARFQPTHSYRVELYAGSRLVEEGVVYLYAPPRHARSQRVVFSPGHEIVEADEPISVIPKSAL